MFPIVLGYIFLRTLKDEYVLSGVVISIYKISCLICHGIVVLKIEHYQMLLLYPIFHHGHGELGTMGPRRPPYPHYSLVTLLLRIFSFSYLLCTIFYKYGPSLNDRS